MTRPNGRGKMLCALALTAIATASIPRQSHALGGYLRKANSLYAKLAYNYFASKSFHTLDGTLRDRGSTFTQNIISLYAEYGVLDYLSVSLKLPVLQTNTFSSTDTVAGVGDLELAAKSGIVLAGFHLAGTFATSFPTGRSEAFADVENDGGRINLPTGDGEFNFWLRLGASRSFSAIRSYASVEGGANLRTKGYSHQIWLGAEAGHHLLNVVWITAGIDALFSPGDADTSLPFIYGNGTEYVRGRIGLAAQIIGPFGLSAGYSNTFANLKNIYGGSTFSGGVFADW